jgi:hypothetical protein
MIPKDRPVFQVQGVDIAAQILEIYNPPSYEGVTGSASIGGNTANREGPGYLQLVYVFRADLGIKDSARIPVVLVTPSAIPAHIPGRLQGSLLRRSQAQPAHLLQVGVSAGVSGVTPAGISGVGVARKSGVGSTCSSSGVGVKMPSGVGVGSKSAGSVSEGSQLTSKRLIIRSNDTSKGNFLFIFFISLYTYAL